MARTPARTPGLAAIACSAASRSAAKIVLPAQPVAFGAVLISSTKSLLVTVYSDEDERARVMGVFSATLAGGGAAGLVLGGVLTRAI